MVTACRFLFLLTDVASVWSRYDSVIPGKRGITVKKKTPITPDATRLIQTWPLDVDIRGGMFVYCKEIN